MEIHDDDPDHFEFILKYMYTHCFDAAAIKTPTAGDCVRRVTALLGIYLVADKYNMPSSLFSSISNHARMVLNYSEYTLDILLSLVPLCYGIISKADHPFGEVLVKAILRKSREITLSDDFTKMVKAHPVFGADVALLLGKEKVSYYCEYCEHRRSKFLPYAAENMKINCMDCANFTDDITLSTSLG